MSYSLQSNALWAKEHWFAGEEKTLAAKEPLFPDITGGEILVESIAVEVADGEENGLWRRGWRRGIEWRLHDDAVFVDLLDVVQVDDVRAVDAHECVGKTLLESLHGEAGSDGTMAEEVDFDVLAHAFDVADVADADAHDAVLGLQKEGVGIGVVRVILA